MTSFPCLIKETPLRLQGNFFFFHLELWFNKQNRENWLKWYGVKNMRKCHLRKVHYKLGHVLFDGKSGEKWRKNDYDWIRIASRLKICHTISFFFPANPENGRAVVYLILAPQYRPDEIVPSGSDWQSTTAVNSLIPFQRLWKPQKNPFHSAVFIYFFLKEEKTIEIKKKVYQLFEICSVFI